MVKRELAPYAWELSKKYPVITITGPRQAGKTTLARQVFTKKPYANLEHPVTRSFAQEDPQAFLAQFPAGAVIDEVQRFPEMLSYIQVLVDDKKQNGQFILTGSQQFEMSEKISQSLAGRTAILRLLPFSLSELSAYSDMDADELIIKGGYPRLHEEGIEPTQFFGDYFETYIQRDVRQIAELRNLSLFERFIRLCAGRVGQLLNLSSLANDAGVSQTTAREWLSILQASYVLFLLPPFHANLGKRLVKTPKLYFYDSGLAAWLCGLEDQKHLTFHPLRGQFFENMVVSEIVKYRYNQGRRLNLTFYRDNIGNEVDVFYHIADKVIPIEIKSAQTMSSSFFDQFVKLQSLTVNLAHKGIVVYNGADEQDRKDGQVVNFRNVNPLIRTIETGNYAVSDA